jgi:hypothetical protein
MKKYLSDTEILSWNNRLYDTPYFVMPKYHSLSSYPMIVFKQRILNTSGFNTAEEVITLDPQMKFNFSFSVAKNRVDNFFHIFNKWFSNKIETQTIYIDNSNGEKISDIQITDDIIKSKKEIDHRLREKEYTKFNYEFEGKLSAIMAYVMYLEDSIEIFSKIWGYDESGSEHQLIPFSIGDIVSKIGEQSEDYLILDISAKKNGREFLLYYDICKWTTKGQIIQYGQTEIVKESAITWSRNNRIDDILS